MTDSTRGKRTVKAANTAFAVLETISDADGLTLTEIAAELDMAKSTVHRYLQTLLDLEYLVKEGDTYYLSLRFMKLGAHARNRLPGYQMIKPKVDRLAEETDERAQFVIAEHDKGVYTYGQTGSHAVRTDPGIGRCFELHTTSAGKAILAEWPDERIVEFVERRGLPARTEWTITDERVLLEAVEEIRTRGWAISREEHIEELCAVGVAITGPDDEVIGGLSVAAPLHRMKGEWFEQELPDMLLGFAKEIELNLQYG